MNAPNANEKPVTVLRSSDGLDAHSTIKEIVRRYANKLPAQSGYEASHDWHTACENIITQACYEYAKSLHVPQYDSELKAAEYEVNKWRNIARRLYLARGCKKNEQLRTQAEAEYLKASNK